MYQQNVNLNSRNEMIEFLTNHFRYNTMNSWNQSTSYANNVKIYNFHTDEETKDKIYAMLDIDEVWTSIYDLIDKFDSKYNYEWQAKFNGRNSGYLVLYQGETKPSEYKSFCTSCGQKNYTSVKETGNICGRCKKPTRIDYNTPPIEISTFPGKSTDMDEDFYNKGDSWLKKRTKLVCDFDKLADDITNMVIDIAKNYTIDDVTYLVTKTEKILVPN